MKTSSSIKPLVPTSLLLALVLLPACGSSDERIRGDCPDCMPTISEISSYCYGHGGSVDLRARDDAQYRTDDTAQYRVCMFGDGSECEVWDFWGGRCKPGDCAKWEGTCKPVVDGGTTLDGGGTD